MRRRCYFAPKPRAPTAAQIRAAEKAWDEALGSIEGRYAKGQVILDRATQTTWKTTRPGRRYHEDVDTLLYPVQPCRMPAGIKRTMEIQSILQRVLSEGHHEPGSRALALAEGTPCPEGEVIATWQDGRPDSLANFPYVSVRKDGMIRAVQPHYDDAPSIAWVRDARLAKRLIKLIEAQPTPASIVEAYVKPRGEYAAAVAIGRALRALA